MSKFLLILFLCISTAYICEAQKGKNDEINAVKVGYITQQLNLTDAEAQKFWPIYNRYFSEVKSAQQSNPDDVVAFQEKLVNIRKKYKPEFKEVLGSDNRVNKVYTVERKFIQLLKDEQNRRRGGKQDQLLQSYH